MVTHDVWAKAIPSKGGLSSFPSLMRAGVERGVEPMDSGMGKGVRSSPGPPNYMLNITAISNSPQQALAV